jgi:type II pantothenate kinase
MPVACKRSRVATDNTARSRHNPPMPPFPLLSPDHRYMPCIQNLLIDPVARAYWLRLFENHRHVLAGLPVDGAAFRNHAVWPEFESAYRAELAARRDRPADFAPLTVLTLCMLREGLLRQFGVPDPFIEVKRAENAAALRLLPDWLAHLDALPLEQQWRDILTGALAANLADFGAREALDRYRDGAWTFADARQSLPPRPWRFDDLDAIATRLAYAPPVGLLDRPDSRRYSDAGRLAGPHADGSASASSAPSHAGSANSITFPRHTMIFIDNAGPDFILNVLPIARTLARHGARVTLAANQRPALNDLTALEAKAILNVATRSDPTLSAIQQAGGITLVSTGNGHPLIDLSNVSEACCRAAADVDQLILIGMGRAIESNFDAVFTCDTVRLALVKDPMVARVLNVRLFTPVSRLTSAGETPNR